MSVVFRKAFAIRTVLPLDEDMDGFADHPGQELVLLPDRQGVDDFDPLFLYLRVDLIRHGRRRRTGPLRIGKGVDVGKFQLFQRFHRLLKQLVRFTRKA